jgi:hypothetical protein
MDEMTQQNAALVEEAAAAAESLQDQAAKLADAVSVFKLDGAASVQSAPPVRQGSVAALPTQRAVSAAAAARPKKLAAAGGSNNEEWEEF